MDKTIGTCSICGGRVTIPREWMGIDPPFPQCRSCRATPKQPYGPTIEMQRPKELAKQWVEEALAKKGKL